MADVTLSFVANDQGVIQSLRRQEAAVASSITRMNAQSASITRKFVGVSAVGGFLGGLGVGSAFGVAHKLFEAYGRSSAAASDEVDDLKKSVDNLWTTMSVPTIGPFVSGMKSVVDVVGQVASGFFGLYGFAARDSFSTIWDGLQKGAELDTWATGVKSSMAISADVAKKYAEQQKAISTAMAGLELAKAEYGNVNNEFERRREIALARFRAEETRLDGLGPDADERAVRAEREANRLRLYTAMSAADRAERDADQATATQQTHDARVARYAKEDAGVQLATLDLLTMRADGMDAIADAAERELRLRTQLLNIGRMENIGAEERAMLVEASTRLFESQEAAAIRAANAVFGGRGVESGLASASGVVRGSLVATARENPAALQRETNQILRKILEAVDDGASVATFAP